jgi:hypothetical protein
MPYSDKAKQRSAQAKYQRKKSAARRAQFRDLKWQAKDRPCADCGVKYPPYVMQFDHLSDKHFAIGSAHATGQSVEQLLDEIQKCDVVCANCHAVRTYNALLVK